MTARILDGKATARRIHERLALNIAQHTNKGIRKPGLAVIALGDNPASLFYIKNKQRACNKVGINSTLHHLAQQTTPTQLLDLIQSLNNDKTIDGILLQLPLPEHVDPQVYLESINPSKDVDGFHPYNIGRLLLRQPELRPCTPYGVIQLLKEHDIELSGKNAVVIGASNIVGRPMAMELLLNKCTTTVCHRFTKNIEQHVRSADIIISATGCPDIINTEWLQKHSIVIDVGFCKDPQGNIRGDIDFDSAKDKVAWITPVPGGVGPMTVAMLLENTYKAYSKHIQSDCA